MCAVAWPNDDWKGEGEMLAICKCNVWREKIAKGEELQGNNPALSGEIAHSSRARRLWGVGRGLASSGAGMYLPYLGRPAGITTHL